MSWDEPTQEEYDDAVIEDTVRCARCGCSYVLPEGYLFGDRSICVECTQDEIDGLIEERDRMRSRQSAAEAIAAGLLAVLRQADGRRRGEGPLAGV